MSCNFFVVNYVRVNFKSNEMFWVLQVEMNKSKTAGTHFNVRVVECRTAAQV